MRYFAEYDKNGKLIAIGAGDALNGVEITETEYNALAAEIEKKAVQVAEYVEKVYCGKIAIENVPAEWQEEVQAQVDAMIAELGPYDPDEISDSEALDIIKGVSV